MLAVADASIVANQATGVLFVVGADQTSRQTAKRRRRSAARRAGARHRRGAEPGRTSSATRTTTRPTTGRNTAGTTRAPRNSRSRAPDGPRLSGPAIGRARMVRPGVTGSMRVLFLSTSGHLGGAERVLVDMVRATVANGGTAGVLTVEDGPLTAAVSEAGGDILSLPLPRGFGRTGESQHHSRRWPLWQHPRHRSSHIPGDSRPQSSPGSRHSCTRTASRCTCSPLARIAPLVWHLHDYVGPRRVSRRLLRHFADRPAVIAANSEDVARDAARRSGGLTSPCCRMRSTSLTSHRQAPARIWTRWLDCRRPMSFVSDSWRPTRGGRATTRSSARSRS